MSTIADEIPPGAEVTLYVRGMPDVKITGTEDTRDDDRERGVLRITKRLSESEYMVAYIQKEDVVFFTMDCEG